jgi:DDE superfamily endonuclease
VWNFDEKEFALGAPGKKRRCIVRKTVRTAKSTASDNREWATLIACISAEGRTAPPYIILKGETLNSVWYEVVEDRCTVLAVGDKEWTDSEHTMSWLTLCFSPNLPFDEKSILIVDGHGSHLTAEFILKCCKMSIIPLCMPPHTSHILQPLEVACFGPLQAAYGFELQQQAKVGLVNINKITFLQLLQRSVKRAFTTENIVSGSRGCRLIPYNPCYMVEK